MEHRGSAAPFGNRSSPGLVVFKDRLWLIGGRRFVTKDQETILNDIWSSSDGLHWELVIAAGPFSPRFDSTCFVNQGRIWMTGGKGLGDPLRDLWYSEDGIQWHEATNQIPLQNGVRAATIGSQTILMGNIQDDLHMAVFDEPSHAIEPTLVSGTPRESWALTGYQWGILGARRDGAWDQPRRCTSSRHDAG